MLQDYIQLFKNSKKLKLIAALFVLGVVILFLILLLTRESYSKQYLTPTNLKSKENFSVLSGDEIYAYNGLAFYKTNIKTGDTIILRSGIRLPKPETVVWAGEKGALLTFSGSFTYTPVEKKLKSSGQEVTETTKLHTWYLDFESGSLEQVSKYPVRLNLAVYSGERNGFYFVPRYYSDSDGREYKEINTSVVPLHFYDILNNEETVVSNDLSVAEVSDIFICAPSSVKVCLIARDYTDRSKLKLLAVENERLNEIFSVSGRMFPTSSEDFVTVVNSVAEKTNTGRRDSSSFGAPETDYTKGEAHLLRLSDSKQFKLGFKLSLGSLITHISSPDEFYIVDTSTILKPDSAEDELLSTFGSYRPGKFKSDENVSTGLVDLSAKDGKEFLIQGIFSGASHGSGDTSLITAVSGFQYLLSSDPAVNGLNKTSSDEVLSFIHSCVKPEDVQFFESSSLFRVVFSLESGYEKNMEAFGACMQKHGSKALIGYSYQLAVSGGPDQRLISD